jgi:mono/diheme cytochrome c family protein
MSRNPSPNAGGAPRALWWLVLACAAGTAGWYALRAAASHRLDGALQPYAGAPLPRPGDPVDDALADLGASVFEGRCAACHAIRGEPKLGPNMEGVTLRRDVAWIQAMVMNPDSMTREDPIARSLRTGYGVQMLVAGGMDTARSRAVLEFLRRVDAQIGGGS